MKATMQLRKKNWEEFMILLILSKLFYQLPYAILQVTQSKLRNNIE